MRQKFEDNLIDRRVYSNMVRAGQRTYFFDVKINRNNHHYLVITESKKRVDDDGNSVFDKF
ncbi:MAG: PUR family DNA/RNA-binding protein, partial [Bacteroidales bacterium]|nr:PUR family DNA/RNA-binding protein [Bacteroidales bacterium]